MSEDVFSSGGVTIGEAADEAWIKSLRTNLTNRAIEIAELEARCEELDAENRRLRAREIVLMRQRRSRLDRSGA
jgi:hypothetical protein